MLVLQMHGAANGLLRLCLVLQSAPDCYHCTHRAALAQTPLHTQCRPCLLRPCHAISCDCA